MDLAPVHECPMDGCPARLPRHILACKAHWFGLPPRVRREVNAAWASGDHGRYLAARAEAVAIMNEQPIEAVCVSCGESHQKVDLRPYGPDGSLVCQPCAAAFPEVQR